MSWYRTGTVAVTNGSKTVTGVGTLFTTAVNVGDAFALVDANLNPTGAWYEVDVVVSNTEITLKQSYAGTTGSNKQYCVFNLVGNMTTPSFAQRLATFFASFQSLIDKPKTTPTAASIPIADAVGKIDSGWVSDASTTVKGVVKVGNSLSATSGVLSVVPASATVKGAVELATAAEATAGEDTTRVITPSTSGSRITFAATSTNDATSPTAAPLKTAGGLAVAKSAWFGGPLKMVGLGTTASRWIGEIPPSTTTAVTILSRSATNGARPAILTIYTSKGTGGIATCGVAKYIIYPSLTSVIAAQWGASGSAGGYESVVLSVDGDNLQATKANSMVGCCLELETLNNTYPWVSPSAEYFSV